MTPQEDHPRSRGVYEIGHTGIENALGSSPLARGLRRRSTRTRRAPRIIPARAGFTAVAQGRLRADADHPRSRGVYTCMMLSSSLRGGSSPLARGLLALTGKMCLRPGIIPARAGFTSRRRCRRCT